MLAGLSGLYILRIPPDFCANAESARDSAISSPLVATNARILRFISILPDLAGAHSPFTRPLAKSASELTPTLMLGSHSRCRSPVVYQKSIEERRVAISQSARLPSSGPEHGYQPEA